jgi:hypothetical protein
MVGHVTQLCRADKRKVGWIKEKDRPFSLEVILSDGLEAVVDVSLNAEIGDFGVDNVHHGAPRINGEFCGRQPSASHT